MAAKKPNILFILIDDLGWMDLSCQGSRFYETPNIDRLAAEGVRFTEAYATCPVCSPTRASIMTGKDPARIGITQWIGGNTKGRLISAPYLHYLPLSEKSLARALKEHGYRTYHVGKWHLGDEPYWPEHHGFDVNVAGCHWGHPWHGYFSPYNNPRLEDGPEGEYLTDRLTDEAIKLIKQNGNDPFFLYMSYYSVHKPIQVPEDEIAYFREKARKMGLDTEHGGPGPFIEEEITFVLENIKKTRIKRRIIQNDPAYAAMIRRLDRNIGRLLDTLQSIGIDKNTIVFFFSDNGGLSDGAGAPTSNKPLRNGKSYMYEGGIRTPLIIKWPDRIPSGKVSKIRVTAADFYPTILEMCDLPPIPSQHVDGRSFYGDLMMMAAGKDDDEISIKSRQRAVFWHYPHYNSNGAFPASAVIRGDYKLIRWYEDGKIELFNLREDIEEKHDLASEMPELVRELEALLDDYLSRVKARLPEPNPEYHLYAAEKRLAIKGKLVIGENGEIMLIDSKLSDNDVSGLDISLDEVLEELGDASIQLMIEDKIYIGKIKFGPIGGSRSNGPLFMDLINEKRLAFDRLLSKFDGRRIRIRIWDDFDLELRRKMGFDDEPLPQLEIQPI